MVLSPPPCRSHDSTHPPTPFRLWSERQTQSPRTPALDEPYTVSAAIGALSACGEIAEADRIYVDAIRRRILPDPVKGRTWVAAAAAAAGAASGTAAAAAALGSSAPASQSPTVSGAAARADGGRRTIGEEAAGAAVGGGAGRRGTTKQGQGEVPRRGSGAAYRDSEGGSSGGGAGGGGGVASPYSSSASERRPRETDGGWPETAAAAGVGGAASAAAATEGGLGRTRGSSGREEAALLLWVDLRKAPVAVIPSAVRRVLKAIKSVGDVSDGLVVQWVGARGAGDEEGADHGGGSGGGSNGGRFGRDARSRGKAASAGRRGAVLEAFRRVTPALAVTEPSNSRGQVR